MNVICITCQIINKEITPIGGGVIFQDDLVILHHCLNINIAGYFIISPVRHVERFELLENEELQQLTILSKAIAEILVRENDIDRVYILSLGEETNHVHFHLFPRYRWMLNYKDEDILTSGKVDGAKLFSFIRKKFMFDKQELFEDRLVEILKRVKEKIEFNSFR